MLDMHDGREDMKLFITDSNLCLVYKVCATQGEVSPQLLAQVETYKVVIQEPSSFKQLQSTFETWTCRLQSRLPRRQETIVFINHVNVYFCN